MGIKALTYMEVVVSDKLTLDDIDIKYATSTSIIKRYNLNVLELMDLAREAELRLERFLFDNEAALMSYLGKAEGTTIQEVEFQCWGYSKYLCNASYSDPER
jgi:phage gp36-like protein